MDDAQELLRDRQKRIQSDYSGSQIQQQVRSDRMPRPTVFRGYNADSGLAIVQPLGGELVQGRSVTNGAIATDATVVSRQAGQSLRIDSMPRSRDQTETIVPSLGVTINFLFSINRFNANITEFWLKNGRNAPVKLPAIEGSLENFTLINQNLKVIQFLSGISNDKLTTLVINGDRIIQTNQLTGNNDSKVIYPATLERHTKYLLPRFNRYFSNNVPSAYVVEFAVFGAAQFFDLNPYQNKLYQVGNPDGSVNTNYPWRKLFGAEPYKLLKYGRDRNNIPASPNRTYRVTAENFDYSTTTPLSTPSGTFADIARSPTVVITTTEGDSLDIISIKGIPV